MRTSEAVTPVPGSSWRSAVSPSSTSSSPSRWSGSSFASGGSRCRSWRPRPDHRCPNPSQDQTRTPAMPWPDPQNQLAFLNGAILLLGVLLYALLGGADFGGGIWDLLAGGPRAAEQRKVIANAIGPIWEANHVWLIFVIVLVFTVFPPVSPRSASRSTFRSRWRCWGSSFVGRPSSSAPRPQRRHRRRRLGPRLRHRQHRHPGLLRMCAGRSPRGRSASTVECRSATPGAPGWRHFRWRSVCWPSPPAPISPPSI